VKSVTEQSSFGKKISLYIYIYMYVHNDFRIVRALGRNSNGKLSVMAFIYYYYIVLCGQSVTAVFFVFFRIAAVIVFYAIQSNTFAAGFGAVMRQERRARSSKRINYKKVQSLYDRFQYHDCRRPERGIPRYITT